MNDDNNFKKLMEEEENQAGPPPDMIANNIAQSTGFVALGGDLIEVFVSGFMRLFISMTGGNPDSACFKKEDPEDRVH